MQPAICLPRTLSDLPLPSRQIIVLPKADADMGTSCPSSAGKRTKGHRLLLRFIVRLHWEKWQRQGQMCRQQSGPGWKARRQRGPGRRHQQWRARGNTGPSITVDTEMKQPRRLKGRPPQLGRMREVSFAVRGNDFRRFRGWRECEKCRSWARGIDFWRM
uniref:Uncharacterized protein n=1 Tax=Oryza meridionalis TaxID=40149 RepID=A0A0E0EPC5_9ORYZ